MAKLIAVPNTRRTGKSSGKRAERSHPIAFLLPAFVVLVLFFFLPTIFNFVYAFTDWSAFKSDVAFVGTKNFESLIADGTLSSAVRVTLIYAALVGIMQNLFGLGLALMFERDTRVNRFGRVIFFIPVLMSALAVGYIFQALLKPNGALNGILSFFSGHEIDIPWLGDTTWSIVVVAFVNSWKWAGLAMIIYLAGLKTISEDVLEAARMDGAGPWKTFFSIKFPLLAPAVTFNFATALLGSLNAFDTVLATTEGGPAQTTEVVNLYIFRVFGQGLFAQATTMSLVLFFIVLILAFPIVTWLRRRERVI
ncbi:carbohydrate ABC transporter permease [Candidatus Aquiluna sp. UB-MaderosW2red]|uniref:carbohydrate ABC transporter permease n=1 Tax=Candidatus Aquiluna sp. UB-MaderosW2red TaxID=1855377 RepID=UPI000875D284|nr:sugar ABC transporter permease [Candidatus Aquiluna sp. UB-MaderosW2red]SCX03965.1 multiple sugar transport system permease protein/raffinose/stachyose/melibiose transport system permease protein [Candidatus Aquiluna sp. UB-MaderosW2red]